MGKVAVLVNGQWPSEPSFPEPVEAPYESLIQTGCGLREDNFKKFV